MPTLAHIMDTLSDDKSLALFDTIALNGGNSTLLINTLSLTRKQYYSRLSNLTRAGLIKRKHGIYSLTAFGKVVYDSEKSIENAFNMYWKLKAIDSIGITSELPKEEYSKIVDALIDNHEIKDMLTKSGRIKDKKSVANQAESPSNYPATANIEKIV